MRKCLKHAIYMEDDNSNIENILYNGAIFQGDIDLANCFNMYFVDSILEINRNIDQIDSFNLDLGN